ncbi:MAG TPA: hypothetical protein PLL54_10535 [Dermatophilaceae bacterium]|nr:hypothetical protein [Dermatophilaceae bacterium]
MTVHSTAPTLAQPARRRHWTALVVAVLAAGAAAVGLRTTAGTPATAPTSGATKVTTAGRAQAPAPAGSSSSTSARGFGPVAAPGSAAGAGGSHTTTRGS